MNINDINSYKFGKDVKGDYLSEIAGLSQCAQSWSYSFVLDRYDGTEDEYIVTILRTPENSADFPYSVQFNKPFIDMENTLPYHETLTAGYKTRREAFQDIVTSLKLVQKHYKEHNI